MKVIKANSLAGNFGRLVAVDCTSFGVREEEVFGFPGANGAGKMIAMTMLTMVPSLTSGSVMVWGHDIAREKRQGQRTYKCCYGG